MSYSGFLLGFYCVFMSFAGFYWVLLGFTGFYLVLLGFSGFYWVLLAGAIKSRGVAAAPTAEMDDRRYRLTLSIQSIRPVLSFSIFFF